MEEPRVEIRSYKKEQRNHTDSLNYLHLATREVDIITVGGSNSYVGQKQAHTIRVRKLFEGAYYSRVHTIRVHELFEGAEYSKARTIRRRVLFEGSYYSRAQTI